MGCTGSAPESPSGQPKAKLQRLQSDGLAPPSPPLLFGSPSSRGHCEIKYKMYVLPVLTFMEMEKLESHQILLHKGQLREWTADMEGRIIFVSHQWLGYRHPDPLGQHFLALKQLLGKLLAGKTSVEESWKGQLISENTLTVRGPEWAAALQHMFLWIDFTGIPNLQDDKVSHSYFLDCTSSDVPMSSEATVSQQLERDLHRAISSIPAYIENSSLMIVLVPPCEHVDTGRMCTFSTWRTRGWCRFEFMAAHLSRSGIKVMVHQGSTPFFNFPVDALLLPPGCGDFSCCHQNHSINGREIPCDKETLHPILEDMLKRKIQHLRVLGRREQSLFYAAVKHRFLDGLANRESVITPSFAAGSRLKLQVAWDIVDAARSKATGWSLLMLAAMADDLPAVREFVATDDVNLGFSKSWPELSCAPRGLTPLMAAMGWASFEVVATLLKAKANPSVKDTSGNGVDALGIACVFGRSDNLVEWLQWFPDCNLEQRDKVVGSTRLHAAAAYPVQSAPALKVLLAARADVHSGAHAGYNALKFVIQKDDSDLDAVRLLLDAGIDVNRPSRPSSSKWKAILLACRTAHHLKTCSSLVEVLAQGQGSTPLHLAHAHGHYEIIRELLHAGADEDVSNVLGLKPRDMLKHGPAPVN